MVWVCAKEYEQNEYLWGISPDLPHEHGEPQTPGPDGLKVDEPCDCTPVEISDEEFDRRREAVLGENLQYL